MLTAYYNLVTKTEKFEKNLYNLKEELKDKKVILFGLGDTFNDLNKKYKFNDLFNIVAVTDGSVKENCEKDGFRIITPASIEDEDYDCIVITNEFTTAIINYMAVELGINPNIRQLFIEEISDERINITHASIFNFEKTLPKLIKKVKNKKVVFYGASSFFESINHYYDLSDFNVLAFADPKFNKFDPDKTYLGYKTCAPEEIKDLKPDYVILCNRFFVGDAEYLYDDLLKGTKIKVKPLVKKGLKYLIKEVLNLPY